MSRNDDDDIGIGGDGRKLKKTDNKSKSDVENAAGELLQFIERVERLEDDKKEIGNDIKEVYGEARGRGYDVKAMKKLVKIRKMDRDQREEEEQILETYMLALGMI